MYTNVNAAHHTTHISDNINFTNILKSQIWNNLGITFGGCEKSFICCFSDITSIFSSVDCFELEILFTFDSFTSLLSLFGLLLSSISSDEKTGKTEGPGNFERTFINEVKPFKKFFAGPFSPCARISTTQLKHLKNLIKGTSKNLVIEIL